VAEEGSPTPEERRAKRDARRAKQRANNAGRAAKMHAARLAWKAEGHVTAETPELGRVHVGCSGWFYWHWRGGFYPEGLPTGDWFAHYADRFKTVELNAPFYSWPTVAAVQAWARQARRRKFIYTVKASELITHVKRFEGTTTLVRDFGHIAELLGRRMGCFPFQLPPSFHYTPARLVRILSQLDPARQNVVEFRHKSWWNEQVYAAFRQRVRSSARRVGRGCRTYSSKRRMTCTCGSTGQAVVPARLHEGGAGGLDAANRGERREPGVGVLQQRPRRLRGQERARTAPPAPRRGGMISSPRYVWWCRPNRNAMLFAEGRADRRRAASVVVAADEPSRS
jgi:uncharacterized protein YecE (DUF72 family)